MARKPLTLAHAGAVFLDTAQPEWHEKIDLTILNARLIKECVLGQLYGDYLVGIRKHGLTWKEAERLCFSSPRPSIYKAWTEAWVHEVLARRVEKVIPRTCQVSGFGPYTTGVQGDGRVYLPSIVISFPTSLKFNRISEISTDIINKVPGIARVLMLVEVTPP